MFLIVLSNVSGLLDTIDCECVIGITDIDRSHDLVEPTDTNIRNPVTWRTAPVPNT